MTWDLEQSIQQTASMVTPEKRTGKVRGRGEGRVETSLDDYGVPQDCIVGSPPSRWGNNHVDFIIFIVACPSSDWAVVSEDNGNSTPLHRVR